MKSRSLILVLVVLAALLIAGCTTTVPVGKSTLVIAIRDAPKTPDGETIDPLRLTVSKVSVHKAPATQTVADTEEEMEADESEDTSSAGWVVVVNETQTVDLMQRTNASQVLGEKTMDPGSYNQIRMKIDSATITLDQAVHPLDLPGGVLRLNRGFLLEPGKTRTLTLDFNVEKSVVRTGSDQYLLKPVIAVISG